MQLCATNTGGVVFSRTICSVNRDKRENRRFRPITLHETRDAIS